MREEPENVSSFIAYNSFKDMAGAALFDVFQSNSMV